MNISGTTRVLGIFGCPVGHTLSPLMHNTAIEALGLDMVYMPFEVKPDNLADAVNAIRALNIVGVNITIPHKKSIIPFLDEISNDAKLIGAVNTIVNRKGKLIGHNTDGGGYIKSLGSELGFNVKGKNVLILGAGGAARAIAAGIAKGGACRIVIANRTVERGMSLADGFRSLFRDVEIIATGIKEKSLMRYVPDADLIVNTTSAGMNDKGGVKVPLKAVSTNAVVSDIIYKPRITKFLRNADKLGIRTHSGLGMLVEQGALSFKLWTGYDMPKDIVYKKLARKR